VAAASRPNTAVADRRIKAVATVSGLPDLRSTLTDGFAGDWHDLMTFAQGAPRGIRRGGRCTVRAVHAPGEQSEWVENGKQYYLTDRNPDPNWKKPDLGVVFRQNAAVLRAGYHPVVGAHAFCS